MNALRFDEAERLLEEAQAVPPPETAVGKVLDALAGGLKVPGDVSAEEAEAILEHLEEEFADLAPVQNALAGTAQAPEGRVPA